MRLVLLFLWVCDVGYCLRLVSPHVLLGSVPSQSKMCFHLCNSYKHVRSAIEFDPRKGAVWKSDVLREEDVAENWMPLGAHAQQEKTFLVGLSLS